jgi:hypothetical protein
MLLHLDNRRTPGRREGNPYLEAPLASSNRLLNTIPCDSLKEEKKRRSITRTMFSDSDGGYGSGCLVQRDLQYLESLGDTASELFLDLAPRVSLSARQLLNPEQMILSEAAYAKLGGVSFSFLYCT